MGQTLEVGFAFLPAQTVQRKHLFVHVVRDHTFEAVIVAEVLIDLGNIHFGVPLSSTLLSLYRTKQPLSTAICFSIVTQKSD